MGYASGKSGRTLRIGGALALAFTAAGCSGWWGEKEIPLPGERIAIRTAAPAPSPEAASAAAAIPSPQSFAAWPQMNGGPARAGGAAVASADLRLVWSVDAGKGASSASRITSSPIMADGRVYALDAASVVTAVDAVSGAKAWSVSLAPEGDAGEDGFGGGLAFDGGRVFATTGFGEVVALDAASGAVAWRVGAGAPVRAAPAVENGRVYVVARNDGVLALDAASGAEIWREQGLEGAAGMLGGGAPAVFGEAVIAPFSSGEIVAYTASEGRAAWADSLGGAIGSAIGGISDVSGDPVIVGGLVVASSQSGRMVGIDLRSGERAWTRDFGSNDPIWAAGSVGFAVVGDNVLTAISLATGETIWRRQLDVYRDETARDARIAFAGPILAGGRLLLVSSDGRMLSVAPSNGEIAGTVALPAPASVAPIVANDTIYVLTDDGRLNAFR